MAAKKKASLYVKLLSTEGSGTFYVGRRNPKNTETKLEVRKYDRKLRRHVLFRETKLK
jgi:large subunit ribosomal protein L33